jgi:hypothetical protein
MDARKRRQRTALLVILVAFLSNLWPLAVPAARAEPLVLGLPFALAWVLATVLVSFLALWWLYRNEDAP